MATTRKKTTTKKSTRRPVKKTSARGGSASGVKRRLAKKPVVKTNPVGAIHELPLQVVSTNPMIEPTILSSPIKNIPAPAGNRLKLWLAVSLSMAVIVLVWAYSVSRTVLSSNALTESLAKSNINEFVGSISESFSDLKTTSDTFIEQTETPQTNTTQPSTTELDNLFSDIE